LPDRCQPKFTATLEHIEEEIANWAAVEIARFETGKRREFWREPFHTFDF
jgi:hypothetical protein